MFLSVSPSQNINCNLIEKLIPIIFHLNVTKRLEKIKTGDDSIVVVIQVTQLQVQKMGLVIITIIITNYVSPKRQQLQQLNSLNNLAAVLMMTQLQQDSLSHQSIASQSGACTKAGNYNTNSNSLPIWQLPRAALSGFGGLSVPGLCAGSAHGGREINMPLDGTNSIQSDTSPGGTVTTPAMPDVYKIGHMHTNNNNTSSWNDENITGNNVDNINININGIGGRSISNIPENEEVYTTGEIKIENGNFDSSQCGMNNQRCNMMEKLPVLFSISCLVFNIHCCARMISHFNLA